MEVDLRSEEKNKRYLYFFVKDKWSEVLFKGLPERVEFGVFFFFIKMYKIIYFLLFFVHFVYTFIKDNNG